MAVCLSRFTSVCESLIPGAAHSTLQDFRFPDTAGGHPYADSEPSGFTTSNRVILWKTSRDCLELSELSTDIELYGNQVKICLQNTPILEGLSIHETNDQVVILFATVGSVHRISFPHPKSTRMTLGKLNDRMSSASIFNSFSADLIRDPGNYRVLSSFFGLSGTSALTTGINFPVSSCSWLSSEGDATFVLSSSSGYLWVLRMGINDDPGSSWELKQAGLIDRLKVLVPSIIRSSNEVDETALCIISHAFVVDLLIFTLCRDLKIRIWSHSKRKLLHIIELGKIDESVTSSNVTIRKPLMRKSVTESGFYLVVHTNDLQSKKIFLVYKIHVDLYRVESVHLATLHAGSNDDLIDLKVVKDELYYLSFDSQQRYSVNYASLRESHDERLILASDVVSHAKNVKHWNRENFIEEIFFRGNFLSQTVARALSAFTRVHSEAFLNLPLNALLDKAVKSVENQVSQHNLSCENESWEKLYHYCLQYQEVAARPLGLVMDFKTGLMGLMAKSMFRFILRPDPRNEIFMNPSSLSLAELPELVEDPVVISSIEAIIGAIQVLKTYLPDEIQFTFEEQIKRGNTALYIADDFFDQFILNAQITLEKGQSISLTSKLNQFTSRVTHLVEASTIIIKELDLSMFDESTDDQNASLLPSSFSKLFTSSIGIRSLCQGFKQFARSRLTFCRNFLLLHLYINYNREKTDVTPEDVEKLNSEIYSRLSNLIHSYYILVFFAESPAKAQKSQVKYDRNEVHDAHLTALELTEYINSCSISPTKSKSDDECSSLLEEFVTKKGLSLAKNIVSAKYLNNEPLLQEVWTTLYPDLILGLGQVLWPSTFSIHVAEFLLGCRNHQKLGEYLDLCDPWIDINSHSRTFLRAYQKLINAEPEVAVELFNQAVWGITSEPFLRSFSNLTDSMETDEETTYNLPAPLLFNYYTKVMKLFKNQAEIESVVALAQQASLFISQQNDPQYEEHISSLNATLFLNFLSLENYASAYAVMASNPDIERRRACLRQFIVKLFDEKQLQQLISFNYTDFQDDFISIIESKARSLDLTSVSGCGYYELLYSFFMKNSNFRKAASIMYEYGRRLSQEVPGLASLTKQISCLLNCLNCLGNVSPKYVWIVKPSLRSTTNVSVLPKFRENEFESKRSVDADSPTKVAKREIEILDANEIRIEYELVRARSRLLMKDPKLNDIASTSLAPSEVLTLLISNSLYDCAFRLAQTTKLSYEPIIKGIASKYIRLVQLSSLTRQTDDVISEAYDCFADNDIISKTFIGSSQTLVTEKMWLLAMTYLTKYENANRSNLHRCLTEELLASGIGIPASLRSSYQKRNCQELIWLLASYNFIEDATNLALDLIDAILGKGSDLFNLDVTLTTYEEHRPIYVPHNQVQNLLSILQTSKSSNSDLENLYNSLNQKMRTLEDILLRESKM